MSKPLGRVFAEYNTKQQILAYPFFFFLLLSRKKKALFYAFALAACKTEET